MRKLLIAIGAVAVVAMVTVAVRAGNNLLLGSLINVNNTTTNSAPMVLSVYPVAPGALVVQHGALTATNALATYLQVSLDGVNFTNVAGPYYPTSTNANAVDIVSPSWTPPTVYLRASCTTTNSVNLSVNFNN